MNSLKHRTPCLCCPQKLFTGKQLSLGKMKLQQKRRWEMKIHVSSVLFSSLPCQRDRAQFFFLHDLHLFSSKQLYCKTPNGTLSYKHWVKIITLHCFILNYNYFCWLVMLIFFFQPQVEASFTESWPVMLKTNWSLFKMNYCLQKKSVQK